MLYLNGSIASLGLTVNRAFERSDSLPPSWDSRGAQDSNRTCVPVYLTNCPVLMSFVAGPTERL